MMMNSKTILGIAAVGAVLVTAFALQDGNAPKEKAEPVSTISVQTSESRRIPLSEGRPMRLTISLSGKSQEELYQQMEERRSAILSQIAFAILNENPEAKGDEVSLSRQSLRITRAANGEEGFRAEQSFTVVTNVYLPEVLKAVSGIPDVEIEPAADESVDLSSQSLQETVEAVCKEALSKAAGLADGASTVGLDTGRVLYAKGTLETFASGSNEATVEASLFLQKELIARHAERTPANIPAKLEVRADARQKFAADEFMTFLQLELRHPDKEALYGAAMVRKSQILFQLMDLGVLAREVSSGQISLSKDYRYDYRTGTREFLGYKANTFFEITTHSKDQAGAVVKFFSQADDLQNNGTEPRLSPSSKRQAICGRAAIEKATVKARLFADGLGMHLGRLLSMDDSSEPEMRQYSRALKASGAVELSDGGGNAADAIADSVEVYSAARLVFELR